MTTVYRFKESGWWENGFYFRCYDPVGFDRGFSPMDLEDCYLEVIEMLNPGKDLEEEYDMGVEELRELCQNVYNFDIVIEKEVL